MVQRRMKRATTPLVKFHGRPEGWGTAASVAVLAATGCLVCSHGSAQAAGAVVPKVPVTALPVRAKDWVQAGSGATYVQSGNAAQVNLSGQGTILHWSSLDVGRDALLNFNFASSTARVLNKVDGGAYLNQTVIEGILKSNGQVYIYNPNGVIFGATARVNVNSLVASSLKIQDQRFLDGLLSPSALANFASDPLLGFTPGAVVVEGQRDGDTLQRAAIQAGQNGLIMLVAPKVSNSGSLSAPDGQVMLAAGGKVYLAAPADSTMRGLRVEVNSDTLDKLAAKPLAENTALGQIDVQRGNATMVGLAVNQSGLVSANTSVNLNGSIYLKAQDGGGKASATAPLTSTVAGDLVLGAGSVTRVLPTLEDTATAASPPAGQAFKASRVELSGQTVTLQDNAQVVAPAGDVVITARLNPSAPDATRNDSRVELGTGSLIDVSGSTGVMLDMESNVMEVELRGGELADNVLLRDSPVRSAKVRIDARKATDGIAVANVKGYLALREHNVGEYTAKGGTITVQSEGRVDQLAGSTLNVSGGWVEYRAGHVNTSKLTYNGRLYDIESAPATLAYDGVRNLADSSANFELGYRQGSSAGTVQVNAPSMKLDGTFKGQVTLGAKQRDRAATDRPLGGQLLIGNVTAATIDPVTGRAVVSQSDQFGMQDAVRLGEADGSFDGLTLDMVGLASNGFSRFTVLSQGAIDLAQSMSLGAGGQLWLGSGSSIAVRGDVHMPGGSFTANALTSLNVDAGRTLDLAGRWTNDLASARPSRDENGLPNGQVSAAGGQLRLYANQLTLGDGVRADVSGGAWLTSQGVLKAGDAGGITLQASTLLNSLDGSLRLGDGVQLAGFGLSKGGSLSLIGRQVHVGVSEAEARRAREQGDLGLTADAFVQGGFASRTVSANGNLDVVDGAVINPRAASWVMNSGSVLQASGDMSSVAHVDLLPLAASTGQRQSASLTLRASGRAVPGDGLGRLTIGQGASVHMDPAASLTLQADRWLRVDGTLDAPAGTLSLLLTPSAPTLDDNLFDPLRGIWLGANARLLAQGSAARLRTDANGMTVGEVLDGGTIRMGRLGSNGLEAATGFIVAEPGSVMDVSGVQASGLNLASGALVRENQTVASAAGTIEVRAREGLVLAGSLRGQAGGQGGRGGTLTVALDREDSAGGTAYPQAERDLILSNQTLSALWPTSVSLTQSMQGLEGLGLLSTQAFAQGGFARLGFKSQDVITLQGALSLNASSAIQLDAPVLKASAGSDGTGAQVRIQAPHVALGSSDVRYQSAPSAQSGTGQLEVNASLIDLSGHSATQGFGSVALQASEDIRLIGAPSTDSFGASGRFDTGHNLTLSAQRIYPTTLSHFTVSLQGSDSWLRIAAPSRNTESPLSAAGRLTLQAAHIVQGGSLLAPFGQIALEATQDIRFLSGSLTSVAGVGTVPLGTVVNGTDWVYDLAGQGVTWKALPSTVADSGEAVLPAKRIDVTAPSVSQASGAVMDLAGGGSLHAYEFTPGPGGSADVLNASGGSKNQTFAINPAFRSSTAPLDWQAGQDGLKVGDQIYLSGGPGLPAGYYTLLPAHYALQAGAFMVEPASGLRDMLPQLNRSNADGSLTLAGYRRSSTDGTGDTRWSGYVVSSSALVRKRSEFTDYDADTFFRAQAAKAGVAAPALTADAGTLAFHVGQTLSLAGETRLAGTGAGKAGAVDIAAPRIQVVARADANTGSDLKLLADELVALHAGSLLLGGLRSEQSDGTHLTVLADRVRLDNNDAHPLQGEDLILVARDTVSLSDRAVLAATGQGTGQASTLTIDGTGRQADGALLRASKLGVGEVQRGASSGQRGTLEIGQGSSLAAGRSLLLDATFKMSLSRQLNLADGAALGISAPSLNVGDAVPQATAGLTLGTDLLKSLSGLSSLSISSYGAIDFYGQSTLGRANMTQLSLSAASLQAHGATVNLAAHTVNLGGRASTLADVAPATANQGVLAVQADRIELGAGAMAAKGFQQVRMQATGEVVAVGQGGRLQTEGAMALSAQRFTTTSASDAALVAGDALTLSSAPAGKTALPTSTGLGGQLHFEGQTIASTAQIEAHAGAVTMVAQQALDVAQGQISVSGISQTFGSGSASTPGGRITLRSQTGAVNLAQAASLDLSAPRGDAGTLSVSATGAQGTVTLAGRIDAHSDVGGKDPMSRQGQVQIDVRQLAPAVGSFDALNHTLNEAGFTESRDIRVREGDVVLGATGLIQAHQVSVSADQGNLTVAGTIDARGSQGGTVQLQASQAKASGEAGRLSLSSTARILANATQVATTSAGSTGDGGRVVLRTGSADGGLVTRVDGGSSIAASAGALIDVSGAGHGQNGTLTLTAPRVAQSADGSQAGSDVAVSSFQATVVGSRATQVEGVKVYNASTISALADSASNLNVSLDGKMAREAADFMANRALVQARLGRSDINLASGIEVRSSGDLTVSVNEQSFDPSARGWDLSAWRFGGQAGTLTLRAQGSLNILGAMGDGFVRSEAGGSMPSWALSSSPVSWNLALVGGADLQAASTLAVTASTTSGDVTLGFARQPDALLTNDLPVALVRTGTGRIDVAAGRDVVLGSTRLADPDGDTSRDVVLGAAIYTAGHATALPSGSTVPVNTVNTQWGTTGSSAASWGSDGGGVDIAAQRDVQGVAAPQVVNTWLYRQGRANADGSFETVKLGNGQVSVLNTAWWTRFDDIVHGVGTIGGGDLQIRAVAGSVKDLHASVATSAFLPGKVADASLLREWGGGNLSISAGQDILGGQFYVQKGDMRLRAEGSVRQGSDIVQDVMASTQDQTVYTALRPVLALGDARASVVAGGDLEIEAVYNPTLARQSNQAVADALRTDSSLLASDNLSSSALDYKRQYAAFSQFSTYGVNSGVTLGAIAGHVLLSNNALLLAAAGGERVSLAGYGRDVAALYGLWPGSLEATAFTGSLRVADGMALSPSAAGQLALQAAGSVQLASSDVLFPGVVMLDFDPSQFTQAGQPSLLGSAGLKLVSGTAQGLAAHTATGLHADDDQPVRIVALTGDVQGQADLKATLVVPKAAEVIAGRDVRDFGFSVQQLHADDETLVQAGRDVVDTTNVLRSSPVAHVVTGPGLVAIQAGRDIDLGNSQGVVTRGNLDNAYLPEGGASVVAVAGASLPATDASLNPFDKLKAHEALFKALVEASKESTLTHFDALLDQAFPPLTLTGGDIKVFGSQFKTEQGGSLDLWAPAGSIQAGLVSVPAYLQSRSAAETGIFTVRGGAIRALVQKDFLVNQGRVFTLGGGDITLVSSHGNIDAGRGTKTASSAPPPLLTTDASGNTKIDIAGSIAGSGIATLQTREDQAPSNVYPVAPRGTFDAGDAGVRATGSVTIVAATVLNASNIQAGGSVSGATVVDAGGIASTAPPSAGNTGGTEEVARQATTAPKETLSLSVELLGYGDETADGETEEELRKRKAREKAVSTGPSTDAYPSNKVETR